jgi:hypothetical protein
MEELVAAIENAMLMLRKSRPSVWSAFSPGQAIELLEIELNQIQIVQQFNQGLLQSLFAPTGSIQEISIENDWRDKFIEISKIVDQYT